MPKKSNKLDAYKNNEFNYLGKGLRKLDLSNNQLQKSRIIHTIDFDEKNTIQYNLHGGTSKIESLPYKGEKNTPFISNDQRKTYESRSREQPVREPAVLAEQKIYDVFSGKQQKSVFPPTFIPLTDGTGNINNIVPYSNVLNQPPVQKVYNVSLTNPLGSYTSINRIYEDIIPNDPTNFTAKTVFERIQMIDFLRNNILEINDGEEINMMGGNKSLLSHIKIIDINPYTMQKNPYLDLARNFILYSAAYPVRFEEQTKTINIGKPSTALNVRIYMMSYGDINCKKINFIDADNFDLWREIKYYDWVKNEIIKRKISPNFIAPILYKIDSKSQLDWDKLELIKSKYTPNSTILELRKNQKKINNIHQLDRTLGMLSSFIPLYFRDKDFSIKDQNKDKNDEKEDITINSGKILILLTEAPTSNILQWAACKYDSYGSVKKMITTGYHTPEVWKSILFQLIYACAILQEKIILFENFSLENNIFIKDIYYDPNIFGSWIYKVDNLDYYIPNYGYILVIDSKLNFQTI